MRMKRIGWSKGPRAARLLAGFAAIAVLSAACAQPAPSTSAPAGKPGDAAPSGASSPQAGAGPQAAQTAARTQPPVPVKVKVAFTALSGSFMPVWVAQEAGLFTQHGVEMDLSYIGNSPTAMAALLAEEIDLLAGTPESGIAAMVDGADLAVVGTLLNKIVQAIHAAPAYSDPNSLRGQSVAITRFGALSDFSVRYLLRRWNLEPERDVSLRQIGGFPEIIAALSSGGVQAGILAPPHTLRVKDLGFPELGNLWTQPLEFPAVALTTRKQRSAEEDEKVQRVVRATVEGVHRVKTDRSVALQTLVKYARSEDERANEEAYEIYAPLFERDLRLSRDAFQTALEALAHHNPQATSFDPDALVDSRFVEEITRSGMVQRLYGS